MKWSTRKALKLIIEWKESGPCIDCKFYYRFFQIEADHVPERGKKLHVLGSRQARKLSEVELRTELAKCDRTCRNCHSYRTYWSRLRRSRLSAAPPQLGGRNLPPGASLVPWTKTNAPAQAQGIPRGRANITPGQVQTRHDPSASRISRFHG